jgi:hypothetical protein
MYGRVLRRRDGGRWIYKKYIEGADPTEYRAGSVSGDEGWSRDVTVK